MANPDSKSKQWLTIAAIAVLAAGNLALYALYAGAKLDVTVAKKEAGFYQGKYQEQMGKDAQLTQDFTKMYLAAIKQMQESVKKGDRQGALDALDQANFLSGFLSRYTRDGMRFNSLTVGTASGGKLGATDQKQVDMALQSLPGKSERTVQYLMQLRELKPGDKPPAFVN